MQGGRAAGRGHQEVEAQAGRRSRSIGSERFGIFRDSPEPVWDVHVNSKRSSATRWAVIAVLAAMATLLMCLILIDYTRSERGPRRRSSINITARSSSGADEALLSPEGQYHQHRFIRGYFGRSLKENVDREYAVDKGRGHSERADVQLSDLPQDVPRDYEEELDHPVNLVSNDTTLDDHHPVSSMSTNFHLEAGGQTAAAQPSPDTSGLQGDDSAGGEPRKESESDPPFPDIGARSVALPYLGSSELTVEGQARRRWMGMVRAAARRQAEAQRRNYYSEGTIEGEHLVLPEQQSVLPQRLAKLLAQQNKAARAASQNQYLVVNSKGVVIPNSFNFPEVVKTSNFPQLQSYKNHQNSLGTKNLQDIINYLTNKGIGYVASALGGLGGDSAKKTNKHSNSVVRMPGKVTGVYQNAPMEYDGYPYPRTEPYINDMSFLHMPVEKVADLADRPEVPYNGHAYIADPFHPYKPSDPIEINQMASAVEMGADADRSRIQFNEDASESLGVYKRQHPKLSRLRFPFLKPSVAQYTEATFKPLSEPLTASDLGTMVGAKPRRIPPLSLMLEIYPMGDSKGRDSATVHWDGQPVAQLRPVLLRRPPMIPGDKKPAPTSPLEMISQLATPFRYPVMHGQIGNPGKGPAFGVTLSGMQGSGVPMLDSKHRMIVMLNFYPKKTITLPSKQRETATETVNKGAALLPGGTFPQRRQSDSGNSTSPSALAVDLAPLLRSLPRGIRRHLNAILRTYKQRAQRAGDLIDDQDDEDYDSAGDALDVEYDDDEEFEDVYEDDVDTLETKKTQQKHQDNSRSTRVDAEPSEVEGGTSASAELPGAPDHARHRAPLLWRGRGKPRRKQGRVQHASRGKESYFDVQDEDYETEDVTDGLGAAAVRQRAAEEAAYSSAWGAEGEGEGSRRGQDWEVEPTAKRLPKNHRVQ